MMSAQIKQDSELISALKNLSKGHNLLLGCGLMVLQKNFETQISHGCVPFFHITPQIKEDYRLN
jgi:hypothetical protein